MRMLENLDYYRYKSILHLNFTQILGILLYINDVILSTSSSNFSSVILIHLHPSFLFQVLLHESIFLIYF